MDSSGLSITLTSSYDLRLVILSYIIATVASYTALDLAGRVTAARGSSRTSWLLGGALAMGVGIWSMHFIAALAFMLPIPVTYDVFVTLISMIPAIIASGIALFVVSRQSMGASQLIIGGLLMGPGIATMHYTGVSAMRMNATIWYHHGLFALSVLVAIVVSLVALWLAFHLRSETSGLGTLQKIVSALVMGGAVVGMHFTGQAATNVTPLDPSVATQSHMATGNAWLAVAIGVATAVILCLVLVSRFFNKPMESPEEIRAAH